MRIYYEFLSFYRLSGDLPGLFQPPREALPSSRPPWALTPTTCGRRRSGGASWPAFTTSRRPLSSWEAGDLHLTPADALLVWLQVYPIESGSEAAADGHRQKPGGHVVRREGGGPGGAHRRQHRSGSFPPQKPDQPLVRAPSFCPTTWMWPSSTAPTPVHSNWITAHDLGRQAMEQALSREVTVRSYNLKPGDDVDAAMEQAVADGAQVLFATTAPSDLLLPQAGRPPPGGPYPQLLRGHALSGGPDLLQPDLRGQVSSPGPSPGAMARGGPDRATSPATPSSASPPASTPLPWGPG